MLTITRKEAESILLMLEDGREITIIAHSLKKGSAKISISADKSIKIHREELINKEENPLIVYLDEQIKGETND